MYIHSRERKVSLDLHAITIRALYYKTLGASALNSIACPLLLLQVAHVDPSTSLLQVLYCNHKNAHCTCAICMHAAVTCVPYSAVYSAVSAALKAKKLICTFHLICMVSFIRFAGCFCCGIVLLLCLSAYPGVNTL